MSVIGSNILAGASGQGGGYNLTRSLRFRSSASASLTRTPASSPTSQYKTTISFWCKRGLLSSSAYYPIYTCKNFGDGIGFWNDRVDVYFDNGTAYRVTTTAVYRDPSAWYHFVVSIDTTLATAADRVKIYVNGVQQTSTTGTPPPQNTVLSFNSTNLSRFATDAYSAYGDFYLTEVNNIDGQALTPSSFGETSATTGVWQPKKYAGTYGTNGFYLPFTDNSALTSGSNAGLGKDFSGNGNYWTTNNISLTAGATYDSMTDVPTLTSATASNFCTWNPLRPSSYGACAIADGNLKASQSASAYVSAISTFAMPSGKWYWEITCSSIGFVTSIGITNSVSANGAGATGAYSYHYDGTKYVNGSGSAYGASYTSGDVLGFAYDADAGSLTCYKNGTSQGVLASGLTPTDFYIWATLYGSWNIALNCGQRPFAYTPPTGFVALNTFNLPTPTIGATASTQANKYFDATTWTGVASGASVANSGSMQPDLVWTKGRNIANNNALIDSARGGNLLLASNLTNSEFNSSQYITSFNSNGFTYGNNFANTNDTYVSWQWRANGTPSTNTAGSITSTVSANTTSGFSVVTYTGSGANATVGHGLGVAPKMVIVKNRNDTNVWAVYHASVGASSFLQLASTAAQTASATVWNSTAPSSTVFSIGTNGATNQSSGQTYVAYCFSEVAGYSKFGSYTGNGNADGTFVALPFKPKFVMIKRTDSTGGWMMSDTVRSTFNVIDDAIEAQSSSAEFTNDSFYRFDALSNGFKLRGTSSAINSSGGTYIYMAFAEVPAKFALGV